MNTFILVLVLATSTLDQAGATSVVQEFNTETTCLAALTPLLKNSQDRKNYVITAGCFKK